MTTRRLALSLLIIMALLALPTPAAQAKGASDRIVISGPGLDKEIYLTDRAITDWLSMASLEDFEGGPLEEPAGLEEGYTLERQYQTGPDRYETFDRVVYYPDPGGGPGYVFYEGIVNGSSSYDGRWYRARHAADTAMRMVLADTLPQPYLLVMSHSGEIRVLDPLTLDDITAVSVVDREGYWTYVQASAPGTALYYQHGPGSLQAQYRLDLAAGTNCHLVSGAGLWTELLDGRIYQYTAGSEQIDVVNPHAASPESVIRLPEEQMTLSVSPSQSTIAGFALHDDGLRLFSVHLTMDQHYSESAFHRVDGFDQPVELVMTAWDPVGSSARFYVTDGLTLVGFPFAHPDVISETTLDYDDRAAVEAGITPTDFLGAYDGRLYLYHPMGRNVLTNIEAIERGDIHRGIFVIDAEKGDQLAHLQPDLAIADGTLSGDYLYAIIAPEGEDNAELVQIDIHTGDVIRTKTLTPDNWTAAITRLSADAVRALGTPDSRLACPDPEPLGDVAEVVSPPGAP